MEITVTDFMQRQPNYPRVAPTDQFYLWIALRLAKTWDESPWLRHLDDDVRRDVVLAVTGYYQDVVADAGLWRTFISMHSQAHGVPMPHYGRAEDYIDNELNLDDVRYVIWWTITGEGGAELDPHDDELQALAIAWHQVLDEEYEEAPTPSQFTALVDVDPDDSNDVQRTYDLAYWLFWRSFLLRPSSLAAMQAAMPQAHAIIASAAGADATPMLHQLNDQLMASTLAGPLHLSIGDWVRAITSRDV